MQEFPSPTIAATSRTEVFVRYLDFFRDGVVVRVEQLSETERRHSRLATGWTPLELVKHLTYVERRWLEWGFESRLVDDPWGDQKGDRWFVDDHESSNDVLAALRRQGAQSREIIEANDLDALGQPGPRWDGAAPATLERILFHLLQEYARHLGHLDIVVELSGGSVGE